ncbi:hypothetical protein N7486_002086 [Penicillium sp. IBT 16267x]|nr:hypothetical protein N7486_002086 [Penicillium sp. IBT 16267x]
MATRLWFQLGFWERQLPMVWLAYITIGVSRTATAALTTDGSVNGLCKIPTAAPTARAQKAAYALDRAEEYFD